MEIGTQGGHLWLVAAMGGSWARKGLPSTSRVKSLVKSWSVTCHSVIFLLFTIAELLTPFLLSSGLLYLPAFSLLCLSLLHFLSEESLQHVRCVMLHHLNAVRRQLGTSRSSPAPLFMVGPLSQWGSPLCEKNPGLVLKAGWFLLTLRGAGFGEETLHVSPSVPRNARNGMPFAKHHYEKRSKSCFSGRSYPYNKYPKLSFVEK